MKEIPVVFSATECKECVVPKGWDTRSYLRTMSSTVESYSMKAWSDILWY